MGTHCLERAPLRGYSCGIHRLRPACLPGCSLACLQPLQGACSKKNLTHDRTAGVLGLDNFNDYYPVALKRARQVIAPLFDCALISDAALSVDSPGNLCHTQMAAAGVSRHVYSLNCICLQVQQLQDYARSQRPS